MAFSVMAHPSVGLVYNPSNSAPRGWYLMTTAKHIHAGDWIIARLPWTAAQLAERRGYLPRTVTLLKRVAAVEGDSVCEQNGAVMINKTVVAQALKHDGAGRELTAWQGCRRLDADEIFLLSVTHPASFDSRYFGPMRRDAVIGSAMSAWTW